jgi:ribosomal protein S18 acetylase RimI-like enzyme
VDAAARLDVKYYFRGSLYGLCPYRLPHKMRKPMTEIRPLTHLSEQDFHRLVNGYTSMARYIVQKTESSERTLLSLELHTLEQPYHKQWESSPAELERYNSYLREGFSLGAFDGARLVGLALTEPHWWNHSLWVWEFHIEENRRGAGVGRQLMDALAEQARSAGFRVLVCETQNTNVPAIMFYRKVGFEIEGVDLSYYTNHDALDGEVAIFMKRRLQS